jgi:predicted 2-oxoglutarate/Fe(II)-dependent dioxygenase YbiX
MILDEYKDCDRWHSAKVGSRSTENYNIRNCDIINISETHVINKNVDQRKSIDSLIFRGIGKALLRYREKFPLCEVENDSGYDLLRYKTGGFYKQHTDSYKEQLRTVAMSINLNGDYVGGELAFFDGKLHVRGGVGSVVMFPANFMYPHQVLNVTEGTRYSIVTWLT